MGIFSVQTISALTEIITGGPGNSTHKSIGIYRSGPDLEQFMGALNIEFRIGPMTSRVPAVRGVLAEINNQHDGLSTLTKVIEQAVSISDFLDAPDRLIAVVEHLNSRLDIDGYELTKSGKRYKLSRRGNDTPLTTALKEKADALDMDSASQDFERALIQTDSDPEDAITAACATLESVCKCILDQMYQPYPDKQDVSGLYREIQKHLKLSPGREDISQEIKQILGGLSNVASGIGTLRTHAGDAHGKGIKVLRPDGRIARLAIHSASTISLFLIETWQRKNQSRP